MNGRLRGRPDVPKTKIAENYASLNGCWCSNAANPILQPCFQSSFCLVCQLEENAPIIRGGLILHGSEAGSAGTRLALQLILAKGFKFYSFQLQDMDALYCYFLSLPPCVRIG